MLAEPLNRLAEPVNGLTGTLVEPVQELAHAPLPAPLEQVVQDSPVAPVRETLRGVVGSPGTGLPGGGLPGGSEQQRGGTNPSGSAGAAGTPAAAATPSPAAEVGRPVRRSMGGSRAGEGRGAIDRGLRRADDSGGSRTTPGRGASDDRDSARGAEGQGTGAAAAPAREDGATARRRAPGDDDNGSIGRTVTDIVEVIPRAIWAALGLITLLALVFLGRAVVERRRARALRSERERLLRDMSLLERVLRPRVPERMGDLAVSVAYRPAAGPAAGGDFYDVFELPGGRVGLFVGDVSGHGREALESTSALRPTLRGHLEAGVSPRVALESAGRAAGVDPRGRFTTAVVAVHDPASGTLTYAQAGHPPPVLVGPGAYEPVVVASSPPIGVGLRTGTRQTTVPMPRGAAACFFTDGLLEARSGDALLGHEWLASVIAALGPLDSAEVLLERVLEAADLAADDMTACLVRAVDGPSAAGPRFEQLELVAADVGAPAPRRFLRACGVPAEAVEEVLAEARSVALQAGKALLTVTIDGGEASVTVTAATREALATT